MFNYEAAKEWSKKRNQTVIAQRRANVRCCIASLRYYRSEGCLSKGEIISIEGQVNAHYEIYRQTMKVCK